ncbi:MAG: hypothetical protein MJZ35_06655 [Bacteroidaceae bacterium]|nr:hypothetical protein [Bacteroidaceae bacterium]
MNHRHPLAMGLAIAFLSLIACAEQPKRDLHAEMCEAAEQYYTMLMQDNFGSFVDGHYANDSLPEDYRSQLIDAVAQYKVNETERKGGLMEFQVTGDSLYADSTSGFVTIELSFGDQSKEEVILPLVYDGKQWKMK